jgi:3-hydroxymyristoyl/3-hydroxydecanoyl-(acyl carrier protein) dehydratase
MKEYLLENIQGSIETEITAAAIVPEGSAWFSGHFPGDPILPGVAQLAMVVDVLSSFTHATVKLSSVRRVRFRQIIRPNDPLKIHMKPMRNERGAFIFKILTETDVASSGTIVMNV